MTDLLAKSVEARATFFESIAEIRAELHRYCSRMTGSIFEGEDVVQETLAKAWYALPELETMPPLRPWLFRIAHNTALDFLRRYERRHATSFEDWDSMQDDASATNSAEVDGERVDAAFQAFARLPPVQRSALALKDVLGLSLEEAAQTMGVSISAVKAALVRARANVRAASAVSADSTEPSELERLRRYAELFNARDWEGLRALFGEETRLDLVSRAQRQGPFAAQYLTRYAEVAPREQLRAEACLVDGVPVIAMYRPAASDRPAYFVKLSWSGRELSLIRDYHYVPYIAVEAGPLVSIVA